MKVRIRNPIRDALRRLSVAIDPATGERYRYQTLDALKAECRLEDLVATYLDQEPEDPEVSRQKFYCFSHEADGADGGHTPSLYVNVEQQRWGCEAGCFEGRSGDVLDFLQRVTLGGLDHKSAVEVLRVWVHSRRPKGYIRVRLPAQRRAAK